MSKKQRVYYPNGDGTSTIKKFDADNMPTTHHGTWRRADADLVPTEEEAKYYDWNGRPMAMPDVIIEN